MMIVTQGEYRSRTLQASHLLWLRVLAAVVREGSVAAAAQSLSITQPAVSNALAKLRQAADDPLLVRVGQRSRPTAKAEALSRQISPVLEELAILLYARDTVDIASLTTRFVLGMPDYLEHLLAPRLVARIAAQAPGVSLGFQRASAEDANWLIDKDVIDAALTRLNQTPAWQRAEWMMTERFQAVYSQGTLPRRKTLSLRAFLSRGHVMVSFTGKGDGQIDEALRTLGHHRRISATASSFSVVAEIVSQAPLIASMPHPIARHMQRVHKLHVAELGFRVPTLDVQLLIGEVRARDPVLAWLADELRTVIRESSDFQP